MLKLLAMVALVGMALTACSDDDAGGTDASAAGERYSAAAVWDALAEAGSSAGTVQRLQQCQGPPAGTDCAVQVMQDTNASSEAIAFFRETGWFLVDFRELGALDLGTIVLPWRANPNQQSYVMNGQPPLVSPEEEGAKLSFAADQDRQRLTDAVAAAAIGPPDVDLSIFPADNAYESVIDLAQGGRRFVFQYNVVNTCHACGTGYLERVGLDFDSDGRYLGASLIGLCRSGSAEVDVPGIAACPPTAR